MRRLTATAPDKQTGIEVPIVNKMLANGFEIIVLPDKSVPIVTVEIAARNGSFTEPIEHNGLSHLYEHMFFKPNLSELFFRCLVARKINNGISAEGELPRNFQTSLGNRRNILSQRPRPAEHQQRHDARRSS